MTLAQEAYALIQKQPENNIRLVIELLKKMDIKSESIKNADSKKPFRRTGLAKGKIVLPDNFDKVFDAMDEEIEQMFEEAVDNDDLSA